MVPWCVIRLTFFRKGDTGMDKRLEQITDPAIITPADDCGDLFFQLFNSMYDGVCIYELRGSKVRALYLNDRYFENVGYTKEQYLPYLDNVTVTLFEEDEKRIFELAEKCVREGSDFVCKARGYRFDGSVGIFHIRARIVDFIKSDYPVFLAAINNISEKSELYEKLLVSMERIRILENEDKSEYLFEYKPSEDLMIFSPGGNIGDYAIHNYSSYLRRSDRIHPADLVSYYSALMGACRKECKGFLDMRSLNAKKTGYSMVRLYYSSIPDEFGTIVSVVGWVESIGDDTNAVPKSASDAQGDPFESISRTITVAEKIDTIISRGGKHVLMAADIDGMKDICAAYGKKTATDAAEFVHSAIKQCFTDAEVFRLISDEFIILAGDVSEAELFSMAEDLNEKTLAYTCGELHGVTVGIGGAFGGMGHNIRDYFITAYNALAKAKDSGKSGTELFRIRR